MASGMKHPKVKTAPRAPSDWEMLRQLIKQREDDARSDEMKGGGHPEDFRIIELEYELSVEKLEAHIKMMERAYYHE